MRLTAWVSEFRSCMRFEDDVSPMRVIGYELVFTLGFALIGVVITGMME